MSAGYRAVQWNRYKVRYDLAVGAGVLLYLAAFLGVSAATHRGSDAISLPILLMRAFGTCALVMLHAVLCIGPTARLDTRFLPLLYNRRHFGVATFCVALIHATLAVGFYHGFGKVSPLLSLLTSNIEFRSISGLPFETLGLTALLVLFLMAATSHDFWLKFLSPRAWKALHMAVYVAWAAAVMHVALGALQSEKSLLYPILLLSGVLLVCTLHLMAGCREVRRDRQSAGTSPANWIDLCAVDVIPESRAVVAVVAGGGRVAVFRYGDQVSAVSNVCAHQGGPLGEGRIIDGCITCPWHGYQYRPLDGQAPPPFTERLSTYHVRIERRRVCLNPTSNPPGTPVEPAIIKRTESCSTAPTAARLATTHSSSAT